jgi:cobalt-precorrin 5A hydrolase/precorrin-3B C17-methyltransferase
VYDDFGATVRDLFGSGTPIVCFCAAGIIIRTIAPLLTNKSQEPPIVAVAEDGSAVVPLLGGLSGVNRLARDIAKILEIAPAITTSGELRFNTALLSPPPPYELLNPDDAKEFLANLLAGMDVAIEGNATWLQDANLPLADIPTDAALKIQVLSQESIEPPTPSATCLVYQGKTSPKGSVTIVGTGPGAVKWLSPEAKFALERATDWVGYTTYLNLVEALRQGQNRHDSDNRVELERARFALDLAATGRDVAVVSSGDPGIFAMAAAVFEAIDRDDRWENVTVKVCPGISAMQAAAALAGAPLGHDFCVISLSDILKPWEVISQRLAAAAAADFAIAIYNPKSSQRTTQLEEAKNILLQWRRSDTPVVIACNLGRDGERVWIKPLGDLQSADADMRTVLIVGSSSTKMVRDRVYTPRYYNDRNPG